MIEPSFVIAGGQRCGTTTLYHLIDEHPEIYMARPLRPEPKYFLEHPRAGRDREWYLRQWFSDVGDASIAGEKSTSYMDTAGVPRRMKEQFPGLKALFILRHPIERAVSNYRFSRGNGFETESFDYAVRHEDDRPRPSQAEAVSTNPFGYIRRGCYIDDLERFAEYFPRRDMLIVFTSELYERPAETCRTIYEYLSVDTAFRPKNPAQRLNVHEPDDLALERETVDYLLQRFAEPNRRLEVWLGRKLPNWNEPTEAIRRLVK